MNTDLIAPQRTRSSSGGADRATSPTNPSVPAGNTQRSSCGEPVTASGWIGIIQITAATMVCAANAITQASTNMYPNAMAGHFHVPDSRRMTPIVDMHCRA